MVAIFLGSTAGNHPQKERLLALCLGLKMPILVVLKIAETSAIKFTLAIVLLFLLNLLTTNREGDCRSPACGDFIRRITIIICPTSLLLLLISITPISLFPINNLIDHRRRRGFLLFYYLLFSIWGEVFFLLYYVLKYNEVLY